MSWKGWASPLHAAWLHTDFTTLVLHWLGVLGAISTWCTLSITIGLAWHFAAFKRALFSGSLSTTVLGHTCARSWWPHTSSSFLPIPFSATSRSRRPCRPLKVTYEQDMAAHESKSNPSYYTTEERTFLSISSSTTSILACPHREHHVNMHPDTASRTHDQTPSHRWHCRCSIFAPHCITATRFCIVTFEGFISSLRRPRM